MNIAVFGSAVTVMRLLSQTFCVCVCILYVNTIVESSDDSIHLIIVVQSNRTAIRSRLRRGQLRTGRRRQLRAASARLDVAVARLLPARRDSVLLVWRLASRVSCCAILMG